MSRTGQRQGQIEDAAELAKFQQPSRHSAVVDAFVMSGYMDLDPSDAVCGTNVERVHASTCYKSACAMVLSNFYCS